MFFSRDMLCVVRKLAKNVSAAAATQQWRPFAAFSNSYSNAWIMLLSHKDLWQCGSVIANEYVEEHFAKGYNHVHDCTCTCMRITMVIIHVTVTVITFTATTIDETLADGISNALMHCIHITLPLCKATNKIWKLRLQEPCLPKRCIRP